MPATRRRARRLPRGAGGGLAPRGPPALDPGRRGRALLRDAVELEGLPARARADGARAPPTRSGAGATRGSCRWSSTPPRARTAWSRRWRRTSTTCGASGSSRSRCSTRSPWAHDHLLPEPRDPALASAASPCTRRARPATWAVQPKLEALAGSLADEVVVPVGAGVLRDGGRSRPAPPGAAARRRCATRPRSSRARKLDACLCSNRTCEIALQQVTGRPFESFVFLLERLTRAA